MKYLLLLALFSCAHRDVTLTGSLNEMLVSDHSPIKGKTTGDKIHPTLKSEWMGKYWQLQGGSELLQDTEGASSTVWFKLKDKNPAPQDFIALSVGSVDKSLYSRFSIRTENGQLMGVLRAGDSDQAQEMITTGAGLRVGVWYNVTLTVDYSKNIAQIYLDGHKLETKGSVKFSQKKTAATPSASMSIGAEDDGSNFFFEGEIRRVLIWKRVLSPEEIQQLQ